MEDAWGDRKDRGGRIGKKNSTSIRSGLDIKNLIRNEKSKHGMHARAVWKDIQTLFRTRAGGPTLYEGPGARARARVKYPEIFTSNRKSSFYLLYSLQNLFSKIT